MTPSTERDQDNAHTLATASSPGSRPAPERPLQPIPGKQPDEREVPPGKTTPVPPKRPMPEQIRDPRPVPTKSMPDSQSPRRPASKKKPAPAKDPRPKRPAVKEPCPPKPLRTHQREQNAVSDLALTLTTFSTTSLRPFAIMRCASFRPPTAPRLVMTRARPSV